MHLFEKKKKNLCLRRPMQFKPMLFKGQLCRQNFLKKEDSNLDFGHVNLLWTHLLGLAPTQPISRPRAVHMLNGSQRQGR